MTRAMSKAAPKKKWHIPLSRLCCLCGGNQRSHYGDRKHSDHVFRVAMEKRRQRLKARRHRVEFEMVEREEGYFSTKPELLELIKASIERCGDLTVHKLRMRRVPSL